MTVASTFLFFAAANAQSQNIGVNGIVKTRKPVLRVGKNFRPCVYPMCGGGIKAQTSRGNVQRTRKPRTLTGNSGHDWFLKAKRNKLGTKGFVTRPIASRN